MSFHVYVETHATIKFCVKLGMMPVQTNVKITSAHMNYKASRNYKGTVQHQEMTLDDFKQL